VTVTDLCCSQASVYNRCINSIACRRSEELYQAYLVNTGLGIGYTYLCDNDTRPGYVD